MRASTGAFVVWLLAVASVGCFGNRAGPGTAVDTRDIAVYQVVADSLYLSKSNGRPIAILTRTLDTVCNKTACPPLIKRWGLDSLWWASDNAEVARQLRDVLIARSGKSLTWPDLRADHANIALIEPSGVPADNASVDTWSAFRGSTGAAALQFSPVGYSADGTRALVVVRMRCGPRCGHTLAAALIARNNRWSIGDLLLVSSDG